MLSDLLMFVIYAGCIACKVRSSMRHMEPRPRSASIPCVEYSQATLDRRGSYYAMKYSQYHALALMVYASMSSYKEAIDSYYAKLMSKSQHRPMSYWVLAEDEDVSAHAPLLDTDIMTNVSKMKQRLSVQEQGITEREKRIKEWHKLLSATFQSRQESDDECSSSSSPPSYDIEAGLVKVHDYKVADDGSMSGEQAAAISKFRCSVACITTIIVVLVLLAGLGVVVFYFGGFNNATQSQNQTALIRADLNSTPAEQPSSAGHILQTTTNQPSYLLANTGNNLGNNMNTHHGESHFEEISTTTHTQLSVQRLITTPTRRNTQTSGILSPKPGVTEAITLVSPSITSKTKEDTLNASPVTPNTTETSTLTNTDSLTPTHHQETENQTAIKTVVTRESLEVPHNAAGTLIEPSIAIATDITHQYGPSSEKVPLNATSIALTANDSNATQQNTTPSILVHDKVHAPQPETITAIVPKAITPTTAVPTTAVRTKTDPTTTVPTPIIVQHAPRHSTTTVNYFPNTADDDTLSTATV